MKGSGFHGQNRDGVISYVLLEGESNHQDSPDPDRSGLSM